MSKSLKHIKITKPSGEISFAAHNDALYKALNKQNNRVAPDRKHKIETVDITEDEIQKQSGFDEKAALSMNPVAANLIATNANQDKRIAELEAALEASYEETKKAKEAIVAAKSKNGKNKDADSNGPGE